MEDFLNQLMGAAKTIEGAVGNAAHAITSGGQQQPTPVAPNQVNQMFQDQPAPATPKIAPPPNPIQQIAQNQTNDPNYNPGIMSNIKAIGGDQNPAVQQQAENNSENFFGALSGGDMSALEPLTDIATTGAKAALQTGKETIGDVGNIIKNSINEAMVNGQGTYGGLQTGAINPGAFRPVKPGEVLPQGYTTKMNLATGEQMTNAPDTTQIIDPKTGQPIVKPQPQNGDKFINPTQRPLQGGTPAQIKARSAPPEPNMQYVPGGAMKPPTEEGLPPLEDKPQQGLPPITGSPAEDMQSATMQPQQDPYIRTHPSNEQSHMTPSAQKRGITIDGKNVKNTADQKQINATLDGYGITHDSSYNQFQANDRQLGMLGSKVAQTLRDQPGTIDRNTLVNNIAFDFMKNDMFNGQELKTANQVVDSLFKRSAPDATLETRSVAPDKIPGQNAYSMKGTAGDDSAKTFNKPSAEWTINQQAARIARDNLDQMIDTQWPQIAQINNDMSDMISARPTLEDNANKEIQAMKDQVYGKPKQGPIANFKQSLKEHPLKTIAETTTVLGGLAGIGYGLSKTPLGQFAGAVSNTATGNSSSMKGFKLNTTLPSHMSDSQAENSTGVTYTADDYQRDISSPQYVNGSNFKTQVDQKWQTSQQLANNNITPGAKVFMGGDAQNAITFQDQLNNINMQGLAGVWQTLKTDQQYNQYTSNPNNPYVKELGVLQQANNAYAKAYYDINGKDPTDDVIMPGDTPEVMKEKLQNQNNFIQQTYQHYEPYWNIINVTPNTSQNQGVYQQNTESGSQINTSTPQPLPSGFSMQQMSLPPL